MQPPMMGAPMAPMMNPMPMVTPVVAAPVIIQTGPTGPKLLVCTDIVCQCQPPQFDCCHECIGFCTAFTSGTALSGGVCWCCYGCGRPDCCSVWCAGWALGCMSWFFYGIIAGCIVGCKMMHCC
uniref:Transmembrane domain-containing protein n=1 Tax=Trepomonas sp. PC1 TaxID=1076344 RepID=A0A146KKX4_9EUKA|eukprot:JAP96424.1 Transmembrane domain-containing protein [Trepomonas sp. PC1]